MVYKINTENDGEAGRNKCLIVFLQETQFDKDTQVNF